MSIFFFIILALFIVINVFEYTLDRMNLSTINRMKNIIPKGFESLISEEKVKQINSYSIDKLKFEFVSNLFSIIYGFVFFFCGLINWYTQGITSLNLNFYLNGILYLWVLSFVVSLLNIPFEIYFTFKIEQKYGFNSMTKSLWIKDFIKGQLVSLIIFIIVGFICFWIIKNITIWFFWVWLAFFIISIILLLISPYVIEPLFNKFTPLDNEEVKNKIYNVINKTGIKLSKILTVDASKRSKHSNAYFSGIGKTKRIVIFDNLLTQISNDELVAIIAHEAGHWKKKHIIKRLITMNIVIIIISGFANLLVAKGYFLAIFKITQNVNEQLLIPVSILITFFVFSLILFPLKGLFNHKSRVNEKEADQYAVDLVGSPAPLISALKKLSADNMSNLYPNRIYALFNYSHPQLLERIDYLEKMKKD